MPGTIYEMYSPHCNKRYIGSTTRPLNLRLNAHRNKKHPLFAYNDVKIRPLEENVPDEKLRKREGQYIKAQMDNLFNTRVAGRTQKEKYWEDVDASRQHQRSQYTPIRDGGDGNYRQLNRYKQNSYEITRQACITNAKKQLRMPSRRSMTKYNFTEAELEVIKKHIQEAKENEPSTSEG